MRIRALLGRALAGSPGLFACWVVVGVVMWSAAYDQWVARGATEYLLKVSEHELGRGPAPILADEMGEIRREGAMLASACAAFLVGAGWLTIRLSAARRAVP